MEIANLASTKKSRLPFVASLIVVFLLLGGLTGCSIVASAAGPVLTQDVSEPLGDVKAAKFDIYTGSGNLTVDTLTGGEPLLMGGTLQYLESLGEPSRSLESFNRQANLSLKWGENSAPCAAAIEWLIHLNPAVASEIIANSGGGNVKLNLANIAITSLSTETGGGNVEVVLPENITSLSVKAKSGAGNVIVTVPSGAAARIHATTGLGTVIIDPRFSKIDKDTYQSPDYDSAASKVELTLGSGAGNVEVKSK